MKLLNEGSCTQGSSYLYHVYHIKSWPIYKKCPARRFTKIVFITIYGAIM